MQLYSRLGVSSPFDPNHRLVTSPFFSPYVLAFIRLSLALYTLFTLLLNLIWDSVRLHTGSRFFSYFTNLSYIGLCTYFWAAGVQTLVYARLGGGDKQYPLQNWPRALQLLHLLLQATITTYPILVTIVFWALLAGPEIFLQHFTTWSNVSVHILNAVFALFEILFTNSNPASWLLLPFAVVFMGGYIGVAYITHHTQGFYSYAFLDPKQRNGVLAAYIVGIGVAECIIFAIVYGIVVLRLRYVSRRAVFLAGETERSLTPEALDEWQEVDEPKAPPFSPV